MSSRRVRKTGSRSRRRVRKSRTRKSRDKKKRSNSINLKPIIVRNRRSARSRTRRIPIKITPIKRKGNCIQRSLLPIKPWQEKVIKHMNVHNSLLVIHSTGSGKTLTAVTVSQCFLDKDPSNIVVFVGPSGLLTNFEKEMDKYGVHNPDRYLLYSYDKFYRDSDSLVPKICGENTLLIIDEAHNIRTSGTKRSEAIINCSLLSTKRLLLTATPYVNSIDDFIPLVNMVNDERIVGTLSDVKAKKALFVLDQKLLVKYLRKKIDVVQLEQNEFFPEKIIKYVNVPMAREYYNKYVDAISSEVDVKNKSKLFEHPEAFYNGHRRAVNIAGKNYFSEKITKVIPLITNKKTVIFTNWLDFGLTPIRKTLKEFGIKFNVIEGSTSKQDRQNIVNNFNNNMFQVLVITKAGSEGLDLHEVRNLVILDPVWNYAGLEQIMGRVARYKSHVNLPPSKQNVKIFLLVSTEPGVTTSKMAEDVDSISGDRILYNIINRKKRENEDIMNLLKDKCSI